MFLLKLQDHDFVYASFQITFQTQNHASALNSYLRYLCDHIENLFLSIYINQDLYHYFSSVATLRTQCIINPHKNFLQYSLLKNFQHLRFLTL